MKVEIVTIECQDDFNLIVKMLKACYKSKKQFERDLELICNDIALNLNLHFRKNGNELLFCKKISQEV